MTDVVFFLKALPTAAVKALPWRGDVKLIPIEPPASLQCGGADRLCSTAYSNMWAWLRDPSTKEVMPRLLAHYAKGLDVGRVAFVGFSASHGLLNPLANNDADRERIDAYVLIDATFGGGKTGYVKFVADAARGKKLFVTTTANTGGDESFRPVWEEAARLARKTPKRVKVAGELAEPSGGAWKLGSRAYMLRYVDERGQSELPHWEQHKILAGVLGGYLVPYWRGGLPWWAWGLLGAGLIGGAGYAATELASRR